MIVQAPALIVPRSSWGWADGSYNYQLPGGEYGKINGVVGRVPAGSEIDLRGASIVTGPDGGALIGSVDLLEYKPPNYTKHNWTFSLRVFDSAFFSAFTVTHDAYFSLRGGLQHILEWDQCAFGTYSRSTPMNTPVVNSGAGYVETDFYVSTQRACVINVESLGVASLNFGAMDCTINHPNAVASLVKNLYTNAYFVVTKGSLSLPAGTANFKILFQSPNNPPPLVTTQFMKMGIGFEVPYGV